MLNKRKILISILLCLLPIVYALLVYDKLPEMIPTHWNFSGEIDGYTSKKVFVFGMPIFFAVLNIFSIFMLEADPKKIENKNNFLFKNVLWIGPIFINIVVILVILASLGYNINMLMITKIFVGIFLIVVGNYIPKTRQNYTVGIRTPWTLNNEENWNKTHRFGGKILVISGIMTILSVFIPYLYIFAFILFPLIIVYSYWIYRNSKKDS
ncbi:SdpI family protein [Streptobacillus moniliformis]|uniref:SdpI family protein n=1 Tax=Streptobacillus moniliformis TaxID=34105 RepID=UPI0007E2EC6F|nr:SdpI family protein [Streptobacillus moniliformis]